MRILVVEDDVELNRQLVDACVDAGYVVDTATDGEEGHFLGDTEPYDAVSIRTGMARPDFRHSSSTVRPSISGKPISSSA